MPLITDSKDERIRDSYWMLVNPFKNAPEDRWTLFRDSLRAALERASAIEKRCGDVNEITRILSGYMGCLAAARAVRDYLLKGEG